VSVAFISKPGSTLTARWLFAKLYTTKTPITATDILNDRVLPLFAEHDIPVLRILTDRGTEYCGKLEQHDYELYLAMMDIEHTRTQAASPQTNGICERFRRQSCRGFTKSPSAKRSIGALRNYRQILPFGWLTIIMSEHIRARCVVEERRRRNLLMEDKSVKIK
jgi:transposase InsO family protein